MLTVASKWWNLAPRFAYAEVHDDETADTANAVLAQAVAWYSARGVTVEQVLSDNGAPDRSQLWHTACDQLGITAKKACPRRPQTNGKIERFHRTLADGGAYAHCYPSETERRKALPAWLHSYNHHRLHSACGNKPPFTRLTNVPELLHPHLPRFRSGHGRPRCGDHQSRNTSPTHGHLRRPPLRTALRWVQPTDTFFIAEQLGFLSAATVA